LRLAVNHTGDSDSTGSITGNILGAMLGIDGIPLPWLERLELMDVITKVGEDLFTAFEGSGRWLGDYPPLT
jgi:ADP-ribosylglycohydrolase